MTVKELIEQLQQIPQDYQVMGWDSTNREWTDEMFIAPKKCFNKVYICGDTKLS